MYIQYIHMYTYIRIWYIYIHRAYMYTYSIYVYMYTKLNCFAVQQKLTQHCKSTILQQNKLKKKNVRTE